MKIRLYVERLTDEIIFAKNTTNYHYLVHVLRIQQSDPVFVFNETGEWQMKAAVSSKEVILKFVAKIRFPEQVSSEITLAFSLFKAQDFLLSKATELGVHALQPLISKRSSAKFNPERTRKLVVEASEQSNRLAIPIIKPVQTLPDFLKSYPGKVFSCIPGTDKSTINPDTQSAIIIGPEGGFSPEENALLANTVCIGLGENILRAETAGIVALALVFPK